MLPIIFVVYLKFHMNTLLPLKAHRLRDAVAVREKFTPLFKGKLFNSAVVHYFVVVEELNLVYILCYCFLKGHIWKCCRMVIH